MATITQTIPNYVLGISEQPDDQKLPGQVRNAVNVVPDVTEGLVKRPGAETIKRLNNTENTTGTWFHYYRDEDEGSYVGQVGFDGIVRIWKCSDGESMYVNGATNSFLRGYLIHTSPGDIKTLTINDTTFLVNKTKQVLMASGLSPGKPHEYSAYIELKQVQPRRQYALNIFDTGSIFYEKSATTVEVSTPWTNNSVAHDDARFTGSKVHVDSTTGIAVRVTITGQPYVADYTSNPTEAVYETSYNARVDLLHGGSYAGTLPSFTVTIEGQNHTVTVTEEVRGEYKGNIARIRPTPVDIEAETSTSVTGILNTLAEQISDQSNIIVDVIGNGLYLRRGTEFNVEALESDLFEITVDTVNDITKLPTACKHGYIVKVTNSAQLTEDDYYLKFVGNNDEDGPGHWEECVAPGEFTEFNASTMPLKLTRNSSTAMTLGYFDWADREVGDDNTNKTPSFVGNKISNILFHRDRLVFLSGSNIILSQPGDLGNFWKKTALTFSGVDRIDISCSSSSPNALVDGIEMNTGLVLFSGNAQYLFTTDSDALTPETAKVYSLATYNYNTDVSPISLGTSLGFVDNAGKFSRFFEMVNIRREGEPDVIEQSKVVSKLMGTGLNLIANSRENSYVLMAKSGTKEVIGYKYYNSGEKRLQAAWFKWRLKENIVHHFIVDDDYYVVDDDYVLTRIPLKSDTDTPTVDDYNIYLDYHTTIPTSNLTYNPTTRKTTFGIPWALMSSNRLVAIDNSEGLDQGRFQYVEGLEQSFEAVVGETSVIDINDDINAEFIDLETDDLAGSTTYDLEDGTRRLSKTASPSTTYDSSGYQYGSLSGDWTANPITIGYLYEMSVELPTIYPTSTKGNRTVADTSASLILQRLKIRFGPIGEFWTTLRRLGKPDYVDKHESAILNSYDANTVPYTEESIRTIPVYERNTNVNVILKSKHPSPATLHGLSWEGDYTNRFYKRI